MSGSALSQVAALLAAGTGAAGICYDSTPVVVLAALLATGSVVEWVRSTAPHDHWREYKRRRPGEP